MTASPLLSVTDLAVGFRGRQGHTTEIVRSLSFEVPRGGALAVVGESGSGKTVAMRSLLRLLPENAVVEGRALFDGTELLGADAEQLRTVRGTRIGMVFQNAMQALNPTLTLRTQLTEHLLWHRLCSREEAHLRAIAALDRVGIPKPQERINWYPFQLSGGMRQRAMIAMALVARPDMLIADEPTTALDVTIQRQVLDLLRDLRGDGLTMAFITHDLAAARYVCDDVMVMRHGEAVESTSMSAFLSHPQHPYSRKLLAASVEIEDLTVVSPEEPRESGPPLLEARGVTKVFSSAVPPAVEDATLTLRSGETLGIVGESGSGKSTLARLLLNLIEPTGGEVLLRGRSVSALSASAMREARRSMQMIFQNPLGSLLPQLTAAANVAEPLRVHRIGTPAERMARAEELLEAVGIARTRARAYPRQFSGGQQQRIAIARALALSPSLLVCDEPTSALDVSIQGQILELLSEIQAQQKFAMVFITHNLAVAQRVSDRIIVMRGGRIVESGPTAEVFGNPADPYTRQLLSAVLPVVGEGYTVEAQEARSA